MAYIRYHKLWRSEFYNNVSAKDRVQDRKLDRLKLKVNETLKKDEKITTNFEPCNFEDVMNKAYLDTKISKSESHISYIGNDYDEFNLHCNKKHSEEVLIEKAVKSGIQLLYEEGLFDDCDNAVEVLNVFYLLKKVGLI